MSAALAAPAAERAVSPWTLRWRRFRKHRTGMASLVILAMLVAFALSAWPLAHILGVDPYETDLLSQYGPPSAQHPLGTDDAGRDELVRLMLGGQISLAGGRLLHHRVSAASSACCWAWSPGISAAAPDSRC